MKKALLTICWIFYVVLFLSGPTFADMLVKDFLKHRQDPKMKGFNEIYLTGVGNAFGIANIELEFSGRKSFYCPPDNRSLHATDYIEIIDRKIAAYRKDPRHSTGEIDNLFVEMVLLDGLKENFPCSTETFR